MFLESTNVDHQKEEEPRENQLPDLETCVDLEAEIGDRRAEIESREVAIGDREVTTEISTITCLTDTGICWIKEKKEQIREQDTVRKNGTVGTTEIATRMREDRGAGTGLEIGEIKRMRGGRRRARSTLTNIWIRSVRG